jgi:hypothetical protein
MKLYRAGASDTEISKRTGEKRNTIVRWRRAKGLPFNPACRKRLSPSKHAQRRLFYQLGWSDVQIAEAQRVDRVSIKQWRQAQGLPANCARGQSHKYIATIPISAVIDRVKRAIGTRLSSDITDDAVGDLLRAVMDGDVALEDVETRAPKFRNRVLSRFASKYGSRSLDEALPGTEDMKAIDLLVDDSSTSWLEEMGASWY